jgi:hypothetical protein
MVAYDIIPDDSVIMIAFPLKIKDKFLDFIKKILVR